MQLMQWFSGKCAATLPSRAAWNSRDAAGPPPRTLPTCGGGEGVGNLGAGAWGVGARLVAVRLAFGGRAGSGVKPLAAYSTLAAPVQRAGGRTRAGASASRCCRAERPSAPYGAPRTSPTPAWQSTLTPSTPQPARYECIAPYSAAGRSAMPTPARGGAGRVSERVSREWRRAVVSRDRPPTPRGAPRSSWRLHWAPTRRARAPGESAQAPAAHPPAPRATT